MKVSVLLQKDGGWQPTTLQATTEEPLPSGLEQLKEWVAYRVIGPTGGRSKVVKEEQTDLHIEAPPSAAKPGAKPHARREVLVRQIIETTSIELLNRPSEWSAPCWKAACCEATAAGINTEQILSGPDAGAETPLVSQGQLDQLLAETQAAQSQLYSHTMTRLAAKLLNEAENKQLQTALMAEGAAGLWDLASDRQRLQQSGLSGGSLRGLMVALRKPVLSADMQLPAACAIWHVAAMTKPRNRLIESGVMEALLQIADSAFSRMQGPGLKHSTARSYTPAGRQCSAREYLALLSSSLGALAVLAVDAHARHHVLCNKARLKLLADVAGTTPQLFQQLAEQEQEQQLTQSNGTEQAAETAQAAAAAPAQTATQTAVASRVPTIAVPLLQHKTAGEEQPAEQATSNITLSNVSDRASTGADGASSGFNTSNETEAPITVPIALLRLKPNQLAAEVLATVLLRDPAARTAFFEGGSCRLLLSLISAEDPYVQLCGAAVVASMANGARHIDCWDSLSHTEPQLLWDLHADLQRLIQQAMQRQEHHFQQRSDLQAQSADIDGISCQELDEMLMDYGCLALWAVTAALAPVVSKQQVFNHLAAAAQLAQDCLQLRGAVHTSHTVVVCMTAVICTIAATPAAADAAADKALMSDPDTVVLALHPVIKDVLLLEAFGPEVTVAKLLAAVTIMMLAGFQYSNQQAPATAASPRGRLGPAPPPIMTTEHEQQVPSSDDTDAHPPFRGVFREALHSQGLLPAVLQLAMHGSSNVTADQSEASVLSLDFTHNAGKIRCSVPLCRTPIAEDNQGTKALIGQVVAAACQYLVAVNQPLPVESCAQVLDFLWDQMSHQSAVAATSTAKPSPAATGMPTSKADAGRVSMPAAQYYAATVWCLSQHEPLQQQLLLDGRWSQMLSWLVSPALHRLKKAIAAGNRHKASATDLSEGSPGGPAAAITAVPRLQLQALQNSAQAPSSDRAGSSATSTWKSGISTSSSNKRANEAAGILQLCLQADYLLLQQESKLRRLAAELPADLKAVYAKGRSSYWAMEINAPSPADLSEPAKLGLSQLVDALELPDSWPASLRLKLLALNSCWCLACADKVMCAQLIELGLPQSTVSNCQAAVSICKSNAGKGNSQTDTAGLAQQLLVAAAGYVTAAVPDPAAVQGLGGVDMTTQLLVSLLTVCNSTSAPAGIDLVLLNTTLSSVAWLSNRKDAAASCCTSKVVAALLEVLRLEKQAYRVLDTLVRQQYMQLVQQRRQSPEPRPQQQQLSYQKSSTQSGSTKRPLSAGPRPASPAAQPVKQPADEQIPLLPISVLQAPLTALQQQDSWLQDWLQQQKGQQRAVSAPSSPAASSRYGGAHALHAHVPSPHSTSSPGRQPGAQGGSLASPGRLGLAVGGSSPLPSNLGSARAGNRESLSNRTAAPSSRSVTSNNTGPWDRESESEDMVPYQPMHTPDGTEGMLALWALLNVSTHRTGQIMICKKGLYTLIRLVQECPDPQRTSVAAAILENLTNARENTAMIYRAELRLKHATLLQTAGIKRMLNNPIKKKQAHVSSSSDFPAAAADSDGNQQLQPQQEAEPGILSVALSTGRSHQPIMQSARRTSKLELAAESGVLTAMLCTTYRGVPKSGIGSEEHKAGMLLSRASQMAGRPAVTVKPPPGSARKSVVSGYSAVSSSSGGYAAPPPREVFSSSSGGFGSAVAEFIPAAAGISTSRRGTPREGEGFFLDSTPAAAPPPATANNAAAAAPAAAAPVPNTQEVKAAFMRWLQEQMPEAVGSNGAAAGPAGTAPATPAAGRGIVAGDDRLQGLAEEADLSNKTTEDSEEDEWLEQQRVAQQLHEFYTARAAQGQMLRGSLASSLRASTNTLWSQPQCPSSPQGLSHDVNHHHAHVHELIRPQSAPPGGRRTPSVHHHGKVSNNTTAGTPSSFKQASIIGHSSSRPVTPAGRTPSPRQCVSPAQHGHNSAGFSPKGSRTRPSSAAGALNRGRSPSPGPGNRGGTDPWAPAVVAYKQLPGTIITKPWQTVNQLLVARPDDDVVQQLAAAATAVLDGHLPSDASPEMFIAGSQRKEALERITQQYQPLQLQAPSPQQDWYMSPSQQGSEQHTEQSVLEAAQPDASEVAETADYYTQGCAAVEPADALIMSGSATTLAGQGSLGQLGLVDPPAAGNDARGTAGEDGLPVPGSSAATDEQQQPVELADRLHVTWGAGVAGRTTDGGAVQTASASTGARLTELDRVAQVLQLDPDRRTSVGDYSVDLCASSTAVEDFQEGALLLKQPNTGYAVPHHGTLRGKQYVPELRGTFSAAVADSVRKHKQEHSTHSSSVSKASNSLEAAANLGNDMSGSMARPITVMDATSEPSAKPVQMLVKGADDITVPDKAFKFHLGEPPEDPVLTMHVFEHVDGAQFCSSLYGHYLLPSGKLAHFYVPAAALKQGHTITMPQPPAEPWGTADWLPDGLPSAPAADLLATYLQPGLAVVRLPLLRGLNWVPVPHLAPQPSRCTLLATRNTEGSLIFQAGPLRLKVIVSKALEQREFRKPLSAKAAAARRAPSGTGAAAPQQQPAPAAGGRDSPQRPAGSAVKR